MQLIVEVTPSRASVVVAATVGRVLVYASGMRLPEGSAWHGGIVRGAVATAALQWGWCRDEGFRLPTEIVSGYETIDAAIAGAPWDDLWPLDQPGGGTGAATPDELRSVSDGLWALVADLPWLASDADPDVLAAWVALHNGGPSAWGSNGGRVAVDWLRPLTSDLWSMAAAVAS